MASIKDVAKLAGVSVSTVSLTLNNSGPVSDEMKERVVEAARVVGYTPNGIARSLRLGRSNLIGFVVADITNPFFAALAKVIQNELFGLGFNLMICDSDENAERELALLGSLHVQRVAGILLSPTGRNLDYADRLERFLSVPIVTIDRRVKGFDRDFVGLDNVEAGRLLTAYLIRLGHELIGFVGGPAGLSTAEDRLAGFQQAMSEAGLDAAAAYLKQGEFKAEPAYEATRDLLLGTPRPTAIVVANNVMLSGAHQAAEDLGFRCPVDISLAGVDEVLIRTALRPKVTIAAQPVDEIGKCAVGALLARMTPDARDAPEFKSVLLPPKLVVGQSCRDLRPPH